MRNSEKEDERLVRVAQRQFEKLIDQTQGGGVLIDRRVMERFACFVSSRGWPAVEACERLADRAIEASVGLRSATPEEAA